MGVVKTLGNLCSPNGRQINMNGFRPMDGLIWAINLNKVCLLAEMEMHEHLLQNCRYDFWVDMYVWEVDSLWPLAMMCGILVYRPAM